MAIKSDAGLQESRQAGRPSLGLFAIGGVGGSGTRAAAMLVRNCGAWIGDDLNLALDNLAFSLMFTRASVLTDPEARIAHLFSLLVSRLQGNCLSADMLDDLRSFTIQDRFCFPAEWLEERLQLLGQPFDRPHAQIRCGWKEPNTHVIIDRLLQTCDDLRYVHVVRDPFYLAGSTNQNQLRNWGPIFLDRPVLVSPSEAMTYWVAVHRRMKALQDIYPGRILFFSFDRLNDNPDAEAARLTGFLGLQAPADPARLYEGLRFQPSHYQAQRPGWEGCSEQVLQFCRDFLTELGIP